MQPPRSDGDQTQAAAECHHPPRQSQIRVGVVEQRLEEEGHADRLQNLLQQYGSRSYANVGVKIVEIESQQDRPGNRQRPDVGGYELALEPNHRLTGMRRGTRSNRTSTIEETGCAGVYS
jgi:hypothetical protein